MQKILRLIARLIVARHECMYVRHCKENAPIYMYYVAPEMPMMLSVIADCPDLTPPNILDKSAPMIILIARLPRYSHISSYIKDYLHWLPISARIEYKVLLIVLKAQMGVAPKYLRDT